MLTDDTVSIDPWACTAGVGMDVAMCAITDLADGVGIARLMAGALFNTADVSPEVSAEVTCRKSTWDVVVRVLRCRLTCRGGVTLIGR